MSEVELDLVGYGRVSTIRQGEKGVSLLAQEQSVRQFAESRGLRVKFWEDDVASGRKQGRPGLRRALKLIRSGEADGLAVYAIDRFARSTMFFLRTMGEFRDSGKAFASVREAFDSSNPFGRFALGLFAQLAELESDLISQRTIEAMDYLRSQGMLRTRVPFGYDVEMGSRMLIENPDEQRSIRRLLALRLGSNMSFTRIASRFNRQGVPTKQGGRWCHNTLQHIFERVLADEPQVVRDVWDALGLAGDPPTGVGSDSPLNPPTRRSK